ncbi:hypothetical protein AAGG74_18675 [Bacillus mexicanus]|uniref:hypothetical protein n=1 Tax=Bacillus mexicanus TaxID=2834415 RepID=UPI003D19AB0F
MRSIKIHKTKFLHLNKSIKEQQELEVKRRYIQFENTFNEYIETYINHKEIKIKLDTIKQGIKHHYEKQDQKLLKIDGIVVRTKHKKEFSFNDEIYEYLEDYGFLPLAVKINKSVEKYFNLDKAKINYKESIRLYTGGKSIVDTDHIQSKYEHLITQDIGELSNEFKKTSIKENLSKSRLEEAKEKLKQIMPSNSIKTEYGTLKLTKTYDYDPNIVFSGVSGKKEIFIKRIENNEYEVIIFPENKFSQCSGDLILGDLTVEELFISSTPKLTSTFVKKREFNKYLNSGFIFNKFEVKTDPMEFFKSCQISMTKINNLIQEGIIDEKDIQPFRKLENESDFIEILTEGALEQQSSLFDKKLMEKAQNYRKRNDSNYNPTESEFISETPHIDISNFSF